MDENIILSVDDAVDFLRDVKDTGLVTDEDRREAIHSAWLQLCVEAAENPSYQPVANSLKGKIGDLLGTGDDYYGAW